MLHSSCGSSVTQSDHALRNVDSPKHYYLRHHLVYKMAQHNMRALACMAGIEEHVYFIQTSLERIPSLSTRSSSLRSTPIIASAEITTGAALLHLSPADWALAAKFEDI